MKYAAPRGTRDILPGEIRQWQYVEQAFADICRLYGFEEIRIPTFESTEVYTRGVGGSTDIVRKEMYTFLDKSDRSMTLRPEGTAGVARSFLEQGMSSWTYPVRLFYNLNLFRYERVAKGRYREFHQLGVEAFGAAGPEMDVELLALLDTYFRKIGLKEVTLRINCIGTAEERARYNVALQDYLRPHLPELCGDCQDRFEKNPMRIIDCKVETCQTHIKGAPRLLDYLGEESRAHFEAVQQGLRDLGIAFTVDPDIVRGLDYYTKTVFEFVSEHVGTQGTICGGGRYDTLIEQMGGSPVPGVGFALGVERLLLELNAQGVVLPGEEAPELFVASLDEAAAREARKLVYRLREAGVAAQTEVCGRSLKAQMKYANKIQARYVLVLGSEELETGRARLKNMAEGSQEEISWREWTPSK